MIKVVVTDDQEIILNGLQKILAEDQDMQLVGMFTNGPALLQQMAELLPHVVLLDITMPGMSGIEVAAQLAKNHPQVRIIALTNVDVMVQVRKMLQQGCHGYLLKDATPAVILQAIRTVYQGGRYLYDELQKQVLNSMFEARPKAIITRREKEILQLIVDEYTNQEIADKLFLSLRTVENHRNNLLQKLGVKNTAGLVKAAISEGLIE